MANRIEYQSRPRGARGAAYVETFWRDVRGWLLMREIHVAVTVAGSAGQGVMQIPETEGLEQPISIPHISCFNQEQRICCNVPDSATQQGLKARRRKKTSYELILQP